MSDTGSGNRKQEGQEVITGVLTNLNAGWYPSAYMGGGATVCLPASVSLKVGLAYYVLLYTWSSVHRVASSLAKCCSMHYRVSTCILWLYLWWSLPVHRLTTCIGTVLSEAQVHPCFMLHNNWTAREMRCTQMKVVMHTLLQPLDCLQIDSLTLFADPLVYSYVTGQRELCSCCIHFMKHRKRSACDWALSSLAWEDLLPLWVSIEKNHLDWRIVLTH